MVFEHKVAVCFAENVMYKCSTMALSIYIRVTIHETRNTKDVSVEYPEVSIIGPNWLTDHPLSKQYTCTKNRMFYRQPLHGDEFKLCQHKINLFQNLNNTDSRLVKTQR